MIGFLYPPSHQTFLDNVAFYDLNTKAPEGILQSEWKDRLELANAYRIVANLGKRDWGWTHCVVSVGCTAC